MAYHYVYRTTGAIPEMGAAPECRRCHCRRRCLRRGNGRKRRDQTGAFSYLDSELSPTTQYRYYLAVNGNAGKTVNLVNNSQLLVMERS